MVAPARFDVEAIKARSDCRQIVAQDLGEGKRRGPRVVYRCPFHDDHTPSFVVRAEDWRCFGCGRHGSAIDWMMAYRSMSFVDACAALGGERVEQVEPVKPRPKPTAPTLTPPDDAWQAAGMAIVETAQRTLWSDAGAPALSYLRERRGLGDDIIERARLGYVPGHFTDWVEMAGQKVPCGIVIPWIVESNLWMVKVRRAAGKIKYQQVAGGKAGALYWIDQVTADDAIMIVEGEFDALTINQSWMCSAVALGSANNPLHARWFDRLLLAPKLLARMDDDEAGRKAAASLAALSRRIVTVQVPAPFGDVNEMGTADSAQLMAWLTEVVYGDESG